VFHADFGVRDRSLAAGTRTKKRPPKRAPY